MHTITTILDRVEALPGWGKALVWILAWPALLAAVIYRRRPDTLGAVAALAVLSIAVPVWWVAPFTDPPDEGPVTELAADEPTPTPQATATETPERSSSVSCSCAGLSPTPTSIAEKLSEVACAMAQWNAVSSETGV